MGGRRKRCRDVAALFVNGKGENEMDHLIDDNDRLKPCPFCGGEATFDHDDNGWNWIECLACGASTNARVSAMDDCKPLLLEQWNKRVPPACGCREGECESKPAGCRMAAEVTRRDPAVM